MSVSWNAIKEGDCLWHRARRKMGNTTMSIMDEWPVKILSVDRAAGTAQVSWNYNPPKVWSRERVERLYRSRIKSHDPR
jgi:hypothetical protein